MTQRIDYYNVAPDALKIIEKLDKYTVSTGLDRKLRELIRLRASQINGCPLCMYMHTTDVLKMGETEERVYGISAWEECDFYTEAEKVALELTEHVTLIPTKRVPDQLYQRVRNYYDEKQYVDLVLIINQINTWNRIAIAMGQTEIEK
ncbi:AhpD family alkylhydroperoxidase [Cytobacillus firmus]|uniref:AhpD family alkylhydroperoxidase n=2 Tax=Cytobacillus TaxID=2675230 RepID=A0A366JGV5_CYTFI|nr:MULTISPECIES: carboxymuconolactone decarboxylase family protein [Cytobacillus]RBP86170.1 AhpD family alkylhydroperoxidase [Cytobacillus firmus]TDX36417.1 AhpD family alkylhydroperoxidase [Cytobacillus oceanisediminis]